jgi:hypothetical protein
MQSDVLEKIVRNAPPLEKDVYVYRGIGKLPRKLGLEVGTEFRDKGFVSTALSTKLENFNDMATFIKIRVPKGTRALFVDSISVHNERELILAPGAKFKINTIKEGKAGGPMYHVSATYNG